MRPSTSRGCAALALCLRLRNRHFLLIDAALLAVAPVLAFALRHDGLARLHLYGDALLQYTLASGAVYFLSFAAFGLYQRYWQDATIEELILIVSSVVTGTLASIAVVAGAAARHLWVPILPTGLPLTEGLLLLALVGGSRLSVRLALRVTRPPAGPDAVRTLIIGAGFAGQRLAREMLRSAQDLNARVVGFVDDDPRKRHVRIMNIPVLGGSSELMSIVQQHQIGQAIIAIPSAPGKVIREMRARCERAGVPVKTVPGLSAILNGKVLVSQVRPVEIDDLLRREPIQTDTKLVADLLRGRRVLVTGAGGSIGSELCRQILRSGPAQIILLGHGENSIFDIHNELLRLSRQPSSESANAGGPPTILTPVIADIRNPARLRRVFAQHRPDVVFHAAAHKHVPLMEQCPTEALANNTIGTWNVVEAARAADVERFVLISTDKAVNPSSVMGACKRAAELVVLEAARQTGRAYVTVRFGNVLGSRGSVVPTFKRQIAAGGPITITHPEMTRYFMTIPEAVQLVLQAAVLGRGGEVFMLDMGDPVKIVDIARDLVELSGLELDRDIGLQFTGVRPGEKLHEELFLPGERYERTVHHKVLIVQGASRSDLSNLRSLMEEAIQAVREDDDALATRVIERLVPERRKEGVQPAPQNRASIEVRSVPMPAPAD